MVWPPRRADHEGDLAVISMGHMTATHEFKRVNDTRLGPTDWVHVRCTCGRWSKQFRGTLETARKEWQGHIQEST